MSPRSLRIGAAAALLTLALGAQQPENNAGFGGIYRTVDLHQATGNDAHLGCADLGGRTYVSARDPLRGGNHVLYAIDANGALVATLPQPAVHAASAFGMRDLCTDGVSLAGGSEYGISIVTPTGALATSWNGHPIAQPITGPALQALGVPRGLAWDGSAANGAGRFYAVNFASAIYEFDVSGNITGTFANAGWSGSGLALDAVSGNLWIDACPAGGGIAEIDRSGGTWLPTGRRFARARPGSFAGGLSEADGHAGRHAPWNSRFALLSVCQGNGDTLAVQRVDLWSGRRGDQEVRLDIAVNSGPLDGVPKQFGALDTLTMQHTDPTGQANGRLCWTVFNFPPDAAADDLTSIAMLGLPETIAPEQRTRNELSIAHPCVTQLMLITQVGVPVSMQLGPAIAVAPNLLVRAQSISFDPSAPFVLTSTNEVYWHGNTQQRGILVEAVGRDSGVRDADHGFWRITHRGGAAAIRSVRLDWTASVEPGQDTMVFDIDQVVDGRRHDGGNAGGACSGTYRNGSDVATGLDYGFAGNHRAACAVGAQNAGFSIDVGGAGAARALTYRFTGNSFAAGKTLEFDCDTDGGRGVAGTAMRGLVVQVVLADGTTRTGALAVDPRFPLRAAVDL